MNDRFIKLPLLLVSLFLCIFTLVFFDLDFRLKLVLFIILVSVGILSAVFSIRSKSKIALLYTCLICVGGILSLGSLMVARDIPAQTELQLTGEHQIEGYFTSMHYSSEYSSAHFVTVTKLDGRDVNFKTYVTFQEKIPENNYKFFTLSAKFDHRDSFLGLNLTPRVFDSLGIRICAEATDILHFTGERKGGIMPFFHDLNKDICRVVADLLPEEHAGLVCALLFGNRELLPDTLSRDFMTLGITHMLVVSGMNIALIAGQAEILIGAFIKRKRPRALLCCLICVFYMALCSFTLSVVRAALMQIIYRLAPISAREYDTHTSLFTALGIIVLLNPASIFDVGLLLSFFATLGIITFSGYFKTKGVEKRIVFKHFLIPAAVSLSACIFVLPLSLMVFECTSVLSFFFTLLFSPLLDALLYLAPFLIVFPFVPILVDLLVIACDLICRGIYILSGNAVHFRDLFVSVKNAPTALFIFMILLCIALAFLYKTKRKPLKVIPAFLAYIVICFCLVLPVREGVYYTTDLESDGIIISSSGVTALVDVSDGTSTFAKKCRTALINSHLSSANLDTYVITHTHLEHISAVHTLATNGYLDRVLMPRPQNDDDDTVFHELSIMGEKYGFEVLSYDYESPVYISDDTNITLQEPLPINSSSFHKFLCLEINKGSRKAVYLTSSVELAKFQNYTVFEDADFVILGAHYPRSKNGFSYRFFPSDLKLFSPEDTAFDIAANVEVIPCEKDGEVALLVTKK